MPEWYQLVCEEESQHGVDHNLHQGNYVFIFTSPGLRINFNFGSSAQKAEEVPITPTKYLEISIPLPLNGRKENLLLPNYMIENCNTLTDQKNKNAGICSSI